MPDPDSPDPRSRRAVSPSSAARRSARGRGAASWLPWLLGLSAITLRVAAGPDPIDDAYIAFRYARNLAEGHGLVYNQGEQVLGISTPLFALALAGLARALGTDAIPWYALGLSALADGLAVVMLYSAARRLGLSIGWSAASSLLLALSPQNARFAIAGMETSMMTAVVLTVLLSQWRAAGRLTDWLAGLALWVRPDALALGAAVVISHGWSAKAIPWKRSLVLGLCTLVYAVVLWTLYGLPLPHSVIAKSHPVYMAAPWENAAQILYHFAGIFFGSPVGMAAHGLIIVASPRLTLAAALLAVPQALLWITGARHALRRDRRWLALVGYPLIYAGAYVVLGLRGSLLAEWYFPPLMPIHILLVLAGLRIFLRRVTPHAASLGGVTLIAFLVTCQLLGFNLGRDASRPVWMPIASWTEREQLYRQAAEFLRARIDREAIVAAPEIGALGYYCDCRVLDTVGLVSPEALDHYPLPIASVSSLNAVPASLMRDLAPDYLVSLEIFLRPLVLDDAWFQANYRRIWSAPSSAFGSHGMLIYERVSAPCSAGPP